MKRVRTLFYLLFSLILLCLSACGKPRPIGDGDCPGMVSFDGIPKEFYYMDENLQNEYVINVTLTNVTTQKSYDVSLNRKNEFKQPVKLPVGKYQVLVKSSLVQLTGLDVEAASDSITFEPGKDTPVTIIPEDREEFTRHWMDSYPVAEILSADMYSGLIQVNRKVMPIKDMVAELRLSEADRIIEANEIHTLSDDSKGIELILKNTSSSPQPISNCRVLSLTVTKNTVVFPDGVTLGSSPSAVCHRQDGIYGEPTRFEGSFLYGWNLEVTQAVYQDPVSGNRLTISFDLDGSSIKQIKYELATNQ